MTSPTKTTILFSWSGHDPQNHPVQGEIAAPNIHMARAMLNHQGIRFTNLQIPRKKRKGSITTKELALFTRQLATMLRAGVPLLQSLELVIRSTPNPNVVSLLNQLHSDIETGTALNIAFLKHPEHFRPLYCSLVAAGEVAGILDDMMSKQIISHSMPWKLKNWPSGISQFCKSAVAYGASTLSKGSLGRLDMQEMPALVLQLILCKFLVHNIYVYKTL
jgi:type IV pilus assembly protein PilC